MLFMFSVCHVIVFLHEGLRFDTQILKKFRMLQAAKHALTPFVRSQITPTLLPSSKSSSSSISQPTRPFSENSPTPPPPLGRRGPPPNRHSSSSSSSISLMSGSGFHASVLPGQCVPVLLFVFQDDLSDGPSPSPSDEDFPTDAASSFNHSSSSASSAAAAAAAGIQKPNLNLKGPGSVIMLARPVSSKTEGASFKKKLHSSLDAQIRFLIKKCRILVGTEPASRGATNANAVPLFGLDASRVVAVIDTSVNQRGESLDFITGLIEEDAFRSKTAPDIFVSENRCQNSNNEELQLIIDFIYRQFDILRGRGGLPSNANSGSVTGVGMVAAAAAAAAASAASGKPVSAPELPSLENWLSSSNLILNALLSVEHVFTDYIGNFKRSSLEKSAIEAHDEQNCRPRSTGTESAVSALESSKGLNMKFSVCWCQRALPAAKEIYLKDLPDCYPTALHKAQLEKALHAFRSMVKGPAVQMFAKKLEEECTSVWESGRQLCDAVSLTGKPCMHQRHNVKTSDAPSGAVVKQHSSGYFFLHACACGRSRRLREDPFDFDSANVTFNCFANCEDVLAKLVLPKGSNRGPLPQPSWSLLRLGGARYYEPSKGLLQIGFCSRENFLLKWKIPLGKQKGANVLPTAVTEKCCVVSSTPDSQALVVVDGEMKKHDTLEVRPGRSENQIKSLGKVCDDTSISFGKGLPSFTTKKPFSEVVAGTIVADSTFPVLQQRKQLKATPEKGIRQTYTGNQTDDLARIDNRQGSQRTECIRVQDSSDRPGPSCHTDDDPLLQTGSDILSINLPTDGKINPSSSLEQAIVYVGFEHECSYGHRFLLSPDHLRELDSSYSEDSEGKCIETGSVLPEKVFPYSSRMTGTATNTMKKSSRSTEAAASSQQQDKFALFGRSSRERFQYVQGLSKPIGSVEGLEGDLLHARLDGSGNAFSLLNRNLPVYMNCPHCRSSTDQNSQNIKFASTVSQLQRIFLVTPPFPIVLATCPVIQFEDSCLPQSIPVREQQSRFSPGCRVILPPESFLTLRLPFVYGVQMGDGSLQAVNQLADQPELTAWLVKCTALQVVSMGQDIDEQINMKQQDA